jgi:hypothetical protein
MKILIGDTRSATNVAFIQERGWGRMCVEARPKPYQFEPWGFDNQAFKTWQDVGFVPNLTEDDWCILWACEAYERRLAAARECATPPYIAIVPDIPASAASLGYSVMWRESLPNDWPWYLALQDGMTMAGVRDVAHMFDGLFLGGSDKFKLGAQVWCDLAHFCGKKFHYARAGTRRKVLHAHAIGADSLDSSFPLWSKERFHKFSLWIEGLGLQQTMEYVA